MIDADLRGASPDCRRGQQITPPRPCCSVRSRLRAPYPVLTANLLEREVVRRIAGARLAVLSKVGHLLPLEDPRTIAAAIRERSQFTSWCL